MSPGVPAMNIDRDTFSVAIGDKRLTPDDVQMKAMLDFMAAEEERYRKGRGSGAEGLATGDTRGVGRLHEEPEFEWLTSQIEASALEYLELQDIETSGLSLFHQKSWPVITRSGGTVRSHHHPNATLSAIFYLQSQPGCGGEILFRNPAEPLIEGSFHSRPLVPTQLRACGYRPTPRQLLLFPARLHHQVLEYRGQTSRWSVSYDISITARRSLGAGQSENMMVHPSFWREFRATRV